MFDTSCARTSCSVSLFKAACRLLHSNLYSLGTSVASLALLSCQLQDHTPSFLPNSLWHLNYWYERHGANSVNWASILNLRPHFEGFSTCYTILFTYFKYFPLRFTISTVITMNFKFSLFKPLFCNHRRKFASRGNSYVLSFVTDSGERFIWSEFLTRVAIK